MAKFTDHEGNDIHILGNTVLTKWDRGTKREGDKDVPIPAGTTITVGGVAHRVIDPIETVLKAISGSDRPAVPAKTDD